MKKITKATTPPAPATKTSAKKKPAAPAVKTAAPSQVPTVITAHINVGFGNTLYIRGDGPGLNWESGVPMDCQAEDKWSLVIEHAQPFVFKVLLNDITWCAGDDYTATPGANVDVTPAF
ncbi:MAG TPA: hypothetical protein VFB27_07575 [Opitutaceae bacterium]|nr:hypothetical protein [Opitutaceae bacterium]